ncbi:MULTISPECIES: NAD(P)-dependent oxidoreductase [unclassified Paenibacillus]|uniref:NAD(P)-dependent oxidoreductase n=1 Tax=unclassified Paenibacillus TaxID=185978 RepID=UPI001AE216EC|nr:MULTISPECIES: NAD(P)-dependent oxidoreductase [unclassified Paenibacillus]MBP1156074.1 ketol-acid reductoisomerase [Paenibacillus sp. PvP091]MBP1156438.1 ketol-acid reductoisomerase [Paenibacillus sp. PvP091]MBP1168176.1 ketol-acid reductoisomerase [Paenibacillus sp. PvR098]MBP1168540.1 ketol-acid reductoisomerase [Paenibacillus sp. PvR098]MBP2439204.1 ketol-acid reductoisomerase [Paenibacillus sp. PvP052]
MTGKQEQDVDLSYFKGKTVAILGYADHGKEHALKLRNNGINVVVALRHEVASTGWVEEGFRVVSVYEAVDEADVIQVW